MPESHSWLWDSMPIRSMLYSMGSAICMCTLYANAYSYYYRYTITFHTCTYVCISGQFTDTSANVQVCGHMLSCDRHIWQTMHMHRLTWHIWYRMYYWLVALCCSLQPTFTAKLECCRQCDQLTRLAWWRKTIDDRWDNPKNLGAKSPAQVHSTTGWYYAAP